MVLGPYSDCCKESAAQDGEAAICGQCGRPLIRCHAYSDCGQLLAPRDHCEQHVRPVLELLPESIPPQLTEGMVLGLHLRLSNISDQTYFTDIAVHIRDGEQGWSQRRTPLSSLASGQKGEFSLHLPALAAGHQTAAIVVELLAHVGECAERYAFSGTVILRAEQRDTRTINKTIHIENSQFEAGAAGVVTTGDTIMDGARPRSREALPPAVILKDLQRDAGFESEKGVRGYPQGHIERDVELRFVGFPADHHTPIPRPFLNKLALHCGRNSLVTEVDANDVRLLSIDLRSGTVDREASQRVSRRHFDLSLNDGRLCIEDKGSTVGVWVDDEKISPLRPHVLNDGSRIAILKQLAPYPIRLIVKLLGGPIMTRIDIHREG